MKSVLVKGTLAVNKYLSDIVPYLVHYEMFTGIMSSSHFEKCCTYQTESGKDSDGYNVRLFVLQSFKQ